MRRRGPEVTVRRRGPGLIQTAARTAVIAGTATAVSTGVQGAMTKGQREQTQGAAMAQQQAMLDQAAQQAAEQALAAQAAAQAAPVAATPPPAAAPDRIAQLKDLASLKEAGVLTDAEFEAEKARILAS